MVIHIPDTLHIDKLTTRINLLKNLLTQISQLNIFVIFFRRIEIFLDIQHPRMIILLGRKFNTTW